jgi:ketosteroid isomerase-like protein
MTVQTQFDLDAFKRAVADSSHGSNAQLDFLCDDVEWVEIDQRTPPSSPALMHGRAAVAEMLCGVAQRGITTTVVDGLIAGDRGAIAIRCEYPGGGVVRENALIELRDGKIARWEGVQAWDQ